MKIYISKPSIVASAGFTKDFLKDMLSSKDSLNKEEFCEKEFIVGKVKDELLDTKFKFKDSFKTRTNLIALSALLPLQDDVLKLIKKYGKNSIGVVIGTTTAGVEENFKTSFNNGVFDINNFNLEKNSLANPAIFIREFFGLENVAYSVSTACTSGIKSIIEASNLIKSGICKAVITGGVDSLNSLTLFGFNSLSILSSKKCLPFSKYRDGTNLGEGASFMIVSADEISDISVKFAISNNDAYHMTTPRQDGFFQTKLINDTINVIGDIDYINLHATGTQTNDAMESLAIYNSKTKAKCSGVKNLVGHTLGAAGAIEIGLCSLILDTKLAPKQVIKDYDDSLKPINFVNSNFKVPIKNAMSLSFAFGGDNALMVVGK